MQNIFLRLADEQQLNLILPSTGNFLSNPIHETSLSDKFRSKWLKNVPWHNEDGFEYDMTALHTRWNHPEFVKLLGSDAVFITVLRDPSDAFESLYQYSELEDTFGMNLSDFISTLALENAFASKLSRKTKFGYLGLNLQTWDVSGDVRRQQLNSRTFMGGKVAEAEKNFRLVMIAEYLPESLVLLAHELCLPLKAVTSIPINVRKTKAKTKLTQDQKAILRRYQIGDEMLYQRFKTILEHKIQKFGVERMERAVKELNRLNEAAKQLCILEESDKEGLKGTKFEPYHGEVIAYKVNETIDECVKLTISENEFINKLRKAQSERYNESYKFKKKHS